MKTILSAVISLLLRLDGVIYNFICYIFDIFYYLCGLQLFTNDEYGDIVNRIYIVLGLVMMFVLAYSLLKAVINPDEFAKGENSFPKLVKNIIVSLVIIVILPTAFQICFNIQNSLLNYDVIPQLILGTDDSENYETVDGVPTVGGVPGGRIIAYYTFKSFLVPDTEKSICNGADEEACRDNIKGNGDLAVTNGEALSLTNNLVLNEKGSFSKYAEYSEAIRDGDLTYYFPISTVAGIFILYVLLNFCFDMALRVVKLAFYQMIAPIPVICRVIPGGKLKDVFSKWLKQVISLFVEVFVRIAALTFGVFLIGIIVQKFNEKLPGIDSLNLIGQKTIVLALLIMSVIIFVKQIPKIIGEMFGIDTGGMKLGLMDKLAQSGALAAGSAILGAGGMLGRNAVKAVKNFKETKGKSLGTRVGSALRGVGSTLAGTTSGGIRGLRSGRNAKNWSDVKNAAKTSIDAATEKREKREADWTGHADKKHKYAATRFLGTAGNVLMGHVTDTAGKVSRYFGIDDGLNVLQAERNSYKKFLDMDDATDSKATELTDRAPIANSAALMRASGGPNISLKAMKEAMEIERKMSINEVMGKTLTDFNGKTYTINSVNDYADYLATKDSQRDKAERGLKKYLKTFGYQENSMEAMTKDVAVSDILSNSSVGSSRAIMKTASGFNYSSDEMQLQISTVENTAWNSSMAGTTFTDFSGNSLTINNENDFKNYLNTLREQSSSANEKLKSFVTNCVAQNKLGDITTEVVKDGYTFDVNSVITDLGFGSGEVQRMNSIHDASKEVRDLILENPTILEKLNSYLPSDKQVYDIDGSNAWEKMDMLINNIKDRNIDINSEINRLLREKEASSGDSNKK